jgi:hypothetical protein
MQAGAFPALLITVRIPHSLMLGGLVLLAVSCHNQSWLLEKRVLTMVLVLQDMPKRTTPSNCQAGGVVHILAANGAKLPVTLKMSSREDARGHTNQIVQVGTAVASRCSDAVAGEALAQQGCSTRKSS